MGIRTANVTQSKARRRKPDPGSTGNPASFAPPKIARDKLDRLHHALHAALPELRTGLCAGEMDGHFTTALNQTSPVDFAYWYQRANVLKRYVGISTVTPEDRLTAALETLEESEMICRYSNERLTDALHRASTPEGIRRHLVRARGIISHILGRFDWDEFASSAKFTPGATTEFSRRSSAPQNKWAFGTHVTPRALPYAVAYSRWLDQTADADAWSRFCIQDANRIFTVNKRFDVDRLAAKPVTLNGFFQLAVGAMHRRRLQRTSALLLPDAQEYHGVLAKIGSMTGWLCTRDLKSASNTVCCGLIDTLYPEDWARVLFDLREEYAELPDGRRLKLEMLSSMGNGFTFEVETLVFYALVRSVCGNGALVSVYGDDIIFPTRFADKVDELLIYCGFKINRDKSFATGSFRESCGGHYFAGVDVKPFYITKLPTTIGDVINLHNGIVSWHTRLGVPLSQDWEEVRAKCRSAVPKKFWGPVTHQGVLWCEWDDARPKYNTATQSFVSYAVSLEPRRETFSGAGDESDAIGAYRYALSMERSSTCVTHFDVWRARDAAGSRFLRGFLRYTEDPSLSALAYARAGDVERATRRLTDRAQWKRITAETLCT